MSTVARSSVSSGVSGLQTVSAGGIVAKKKSSTRELIDTLEDKRYVRRGKGGRFKQSDDVGRSLAADRRKKAKRKVPKGQGDRGDR
jgi:hypothetical protein